MSVINENYITNRLTELKENYIFKHEVRDHNECRFEHSAPLVTTDLRCITHPDNLKGIKRLAQTLKVLFLKLTGQISKHKVALKLHEMVDHPTFKNVSKKDQDERTLLVDAFKSVVIDLRERFPILKESLAVVVNKI